MKMKYQLIVIFTFCFSFSFSQNDTPTPIATDRPLQSEVPVVLPKKYLQMETGVQYRRGIGEGSFIYPNESFRNDEYQLPNLLLRYGLLKKLELRLMANYYEYKLVHTTNSKEESTHAGKLSDLELGLKYSLMQESTHDLNLVVSAHGSRTLWQGDEEPVKDINSRYRITMGRSIGKRMYFACALEHQSIIDINRTLFLLQTGYAIAEKLTLIAEIYGFRYDYDAYSYAINGALVYLLNNNHQLDISAGKGFDSYDFYVALGYSFRLRL